MKGQKAKTKLDLRSRDPACAAELQQLYMEGKEALSQTPLECLNAVRALRAHRIADGSAVPLLLAAELAFKGGLQLLLTMAQRPGIELRRVAPEQQDSMEAVMESLWVAARDCTREGDHACALQPVPAVLHIPGWEGC